MNEAERIGGAPDVGAAATDRETTAGEGVASGSGAHVADVLAREPGWNGSRPRGPERREHRVAADTAPLVPGGEREFVRSTVAGSVDAAARKVADHPPGIVPPLERQPVVIRVGGGAEYGSVYGIYESVGTCIRHWRPILGRWLHQHDCPMSAGEQEVRSSVSVQIRRVEPPHDG